MQRVLKKSMYGGIFAPETGDSVKELGRMTGKTLPQQATQDYICFKFCTVLVSYKNTKRASDGTEP
jgi:hypothetical protein